MYMYVSMIEPQDSCETGGQPDCPWKEKILLIPRQVLLAEYYVAREGVSRESFDILTEPRGLARAGHDWTDLAGYLVWQVPPEPG